MARARILVADDHKEMRNKVVRLLEPEFEMLEPVAVLDRHERRQPQERLGDLLSQTFDWGVLSMLEHLRDKLHS